MESGGRRSHGLLTPIKNAPVPSDVFVSAEFEYMGNKYRNASVVADRDDEGRAAKGKSVRRRRRDLDEGTTDSAAGGASNASDGGGTPRRKPVKKRARREEATHDDSGEGRVEEASPAAHSRDGREKKGRRKGKLADVAHATDSDGDGQSTMPSDEERRSRKSRRSRKGRKPRSRTQSQSVTPHSVSHSGDEAPMGASTPAHRSMAAMVDGEDGVMRSPSPAAGESPLRVFCATWNMHDEKPPPSLAALVRPLEGTEADCDVYAVGVQEQSWQQRQWEAALHAELGPEYVLLHSHSMLAIHLAIFVRKGLLSRVTDVESAHVSTGIANVVGNKGGVGIAFRIFDTNILFLNCHLAAHQSKADERNKDYRRIVREMPLPHKRVIRKALSIGGLREEGGDGKSKFRDVTSEYDVAFFMGDLNYRINGTRRLVDAFVDNAMRDVMLSNDQLSHARIRGLSFWGFSEPHIEFPPTFKFDLDSDTYDTSGKVRIPSWTDRILTRDNSVPAAAAACPGAAGDAQMDTSVGTNTSGREQHAESVLRGHASLVQPGLGRLFPRAYNCCPSFRMSDHRPVFAIHELAVSRGGAANKASRRTQTGVCAIL